MGSAVSSRLRETSSASSASYQTLVLLHKSRSVLVRLPETYAGAQRAARNAFGLGAKEDELRLLIEGEGGDLLEVGADVWPIVQPNQRVIVQLRGEVEEEEQALGRSGKRRRLEQGEGPVKKVRFEPPRALGSVLWIDWAAGPNRFSSPAEPSPFATTSARQPHHRGKGEAVAVASPDSFASSDEDSHSEVALVLKVDEELVRHDTSFGTAVAAPFICRFAAEHGQPILGECEDYEEDYLMVKEHSNTQPFRIQISSQATVEQLYRLLENTTRAPRSEFTVLRENAEIMGDKGYKHLWHWSVKSGDTVMLVWLEQVVAQVLLMPRRHWLSVEAFPTSTYGSVRARVASALSLPLDDLYIVRSCDPTPPFEPEECVDLSRPLQPGNRYSALVPMQMWILSEADPEPAWGRNPEPAGVVCSEEDHHVSSSEFPTRNAEVGPSSSWTTGAQKAGDAAVADVS
ncbi:hypothetical protein JCM1841_002127 [Sporobolomyces salmonicolor]